MSEPNATPTRADVLREFYPCATTCRDCLRDGCERGGREPDPHAMADEIVRLRGQLASAKGELGVARFAFDQTRAAFDAVNVPHEQARADALRRFAEEIEREGYETVDAVLAALREGGDDGTDR